VPCETHSGVCTDRKEGFCETNPSQPCVLHVQREWRRYGVARSLGLVQPSIHHTEAKRRGLVAAMISREGYTLWQGAGPSRSLPTVERFTNATTERRYAHDDDDR
jgi:hypothetical protein